MSDSSNLSDLTICHLLTRGSNPYKLYIKLSSLLRVGMSDTKYIKKLRNLLQLVTDGKNEKMIVDVIRSSKEYKDRIKRVNTYIDKLPRDQDFFTFRLTDIVKVFKKLIDIDVPSVFRDMRSWINSIKQMFTSHTCDVRIKLNYALATGAVTKYIESRVGFKRINRIDALFSDLADLIKYMEKNGMNTNKALITDDGRIDRDIDINIKHDSITDGVADKLSKIIADIGSASGEILYVFMFNEWEPFIDIEFTCPVRNSNGEVLVFAFLDMIQNDENPGQILQDISAILTMRNNAIIFYEIYAGSLQNEKQIKKGIFDTDDDSIYSLSPLYPVYLYDPIQQFQRYVELLKSKIDPDYIHIYTMMNENKSPESICDAIDNIIDRMLPECKVVQTIDKILSELHMLFMVDDYPVGTEFDKKGPLVYVCKRIVKQIQEKASFKVSSRFIVAKRNYKASIMRNTALGYAYTKYLVFSDDDDIGCSISELVTREINKKEYNEFAVFPISAASVNNLKDLCGMWRYVINVQLARLLCFNNPPYLMTGEDAVTVNFFGNQVFKSIVDVNTSTTDGKVGYIYMEASNRYTDGFMQRVERNIFTRIFMNLLSLDSSNFKWTLKAYSLDSNAIERKAKEYIIDGIGVRTELIEAVNEFTIFDILSESPVDKPYFAFATQRPSIDEVKACPSNFMFNVKPRKASIDHDTGTVSYDDKEYSADEWNTFLRDQVGSSIKDDVMDKLLKNVADKKEDLFEGVNIDGIIEPRLRVFGGKSTWNKWFKIIMMVVIVGIIIIVIVCIVVKLINTRSGSTKESSMSGA